MQILANPENYINAIASVQPEKPGQYASIISNFLCKLSLYAMRHTSLWFCSGNMCTFHKHVEELADSYESENVFTEWNRQ